MKITVLTLFPHLLETYFRTSILGRLTQAGSIIEDVVDIRSFTDDKHGSCDDVPYGGGPGMIISPQPLSSALDYVNAKNRHVIYPTPSGKLFRYSDAYRLASMKDMVIICGRYEGIDQRIIEEYVDEEMSIGDYVLASGDIAAMVIIDAVYRLQNGVLCSDSLQEESFQGGMLEYPQYTRPQVFKGRKVPEVLLSGHHQKIKEWRYQQRIKKTVKNRPDMMSGYVKEKGV